MNIYITSLTENNREVVYSVSIQQSQPIYAQVENSLGNKISNKLLYYQNASGSYVKLSQNSLASNLASIDPQEMIVLHALSDAQYQEKMLAQLFSRPLENIRQSDPFQFDSTNVSIDALTQDLRNFLIRNTILRPTQQNQPLSEQNQPLSEQNQPLSEQNQPLSQQNQPLSQQNQPLSQQNQPDSNEKCNSEGNQGFDSGRPSTYKPESPESTGEWFYFYGPEGIITTDKRVVDWDHIDEFEKLWSETLETLKKIKKPINHLFCFLQEEKIPIQKGFLTPEQQQKLKRFTYNR